MVLSKKQEHAKLSFETAVLYKLWPQLLSLGAKMNILRFYTSVSISLSLFAFLSICLSLSLLLCEEKTDVAGIEKIIFN